MPPPSNRRANGQATNGSEADAACSSSGGGSGRANDATNRQLDRAANANSQAQDDADDELPLQSVEVPDAEDELDAAASGMGGGLDGDYDVDGRAAAMLNSDFESDYTALTQTFYRMTGSTGNGDEVANGNAADNAQQQAQQLRRKLQEDGDDLPDEMIDVSVDVTEEHDYIDNILDRSACSSYECPPMRLPQHERNAAATLGEPLPLADEGCMESIPTTDIAQPQQPPQQQPQVVVTATASGGQHARLAGLSRAGSLPSETAGQQQQTAPATLQQQQQQRWWWDAMVASHSATMNNSSTPSKLAAAAAAANAADPGAAVTQALSSLLNTAMLSSAERQSLSAAHSASLSQQQQQQAAAAAAASATTAHSTPNHGGARAHQLGNNLAGVPGNNQNRLPLQNAVAVARAAANQPPLGWQATKQTLKDRFSFMFCNDILADVHFIVGRGEQRQRIPAHKFVLSVGSAVFDAMFNGPMAAHPHAHEPDIELPDVEVSAFLALLKFLYSDDVQIGPESVMTTLYTAKKYAVPALENACVDFLKKNLSHDNAFMLLTQARLFDEPQLAALCLENIDKQTAEALSAEGFTDIDLDTLCAVLERDTLRIREVQLFNAVVRWSIEECHRAQLPVTPDNQRQVLGRCLQLIRFPLMTVEEFAQTVAQLGILNDRELVNLFLYFTVNPKPPVSFLDVPRCCVTGKEQVVNRFQRIEGRWGYSGTPDRIKFTVDRRIFLVGFGLYGSIHGPTEYQVNIQLIHCGTGKILGANDTTFPCDGSSGTFRVLFKEPVEICPCVTYIASACLKGPDSHYGTKGLRRIVHQSPTSGCVTFQFTYAAGNNNGTSVEDGQIPEIIFYTKLT